MRNKNLLKEKRWRELRKEIIKTGEGSKGGKERKKDEGRERGKEG